MNLVNYCLLMLTMISYGEDFHFSDPHQKSGTPPAETSATLSLTQQFQLDFLYQELNQFPDLFVHDWTENSNVQLILESAELAVQDSSVDTQPIMRERIIALFAQIDISIKFSSQNLIIRIDDTVNHDVLNSQNTTHKTKHIKIKKPRKHYIPNQDLTKLPTLEKIKGANRTRRRIKKKFADREREQREEELNRIRQNNLIKSKAAPVERPAEHINSSEFWHAQLLNQQHEEHSEEFHDPSPEHSIRGNE